jgi:adenylate cyclase class 2
MAGGEENESKHRVVDAAALVAALADLRFQATGEGLHRDEYYDSPESILRSGDVVCRLRISPEAVIAAFKGPRTFNADGSHRRIEVEVPVATAGEARAALERQGLQRIWLLEKRRRVYRHPARPIEVALDELPGLGLFVELEGPPGEIEELRRSLGDAVGAAEPRNYHELAIAENPDATGLTFTGPG